MRSDIDIQPGYINARTDIDGYGTKISCEVFDAVEFHNSEEDVASYAENVGEEEHLG